MTAAQAPARGFPPAEFEARCARAQAMMAEAGMDALLLTTEPEVRYFTGFLTQFWQSPTRPWFVVLPAAGKPVAVVPRIGAECMARTWVEDIRTWSSPRPEDEGVSLLAEALGEALAGGTLGLAQGPETHLRMPLADFNRLLDRLGGAQTADATPILRALRTIKSEAEIAKIAHICGVVSGVFERLPEFVHEGLSEIEVFRRFKTACLEAGADDVAYLVGGSGPGGYGDIISPPSERRLAAGDVLILDTGCVFDGYFCDFDRNYAFAHADEAARRAYAAAFEATDAGFAAARPGATCAEVFAAMHEVLAAAGSQGDDVGRYGHGLGMQLTEWPSNTASDATVLEPGMVLTLEPGMAYAPGCVMVHEENIVIREDGPAYLTRRAPPELPVIGG